MNVLVLHSQVTFERGGAENLVYGLAEALSDRGHSVDVVGLPLKWNPTERLLTTALSWRLLDLTESNGRQVDRVICTKFPTWAVDHPRKSLWLVHQHRQAYDLFGTPMSEFGPDRRSEDVRQRVIDIDRIGLGSCDRRFAISRNVCERLKKFCGIESDPLYPPVPIEGLSPEKFAPFILSVGRLDSLKRVKYLVEAWPQVQSNLKLMIVGDGPDYAEISKRIERLQLSGRVELLGRIDQAHLRSLYNTCRGVYYAPLDEDYGYVTVEALTAGKPIICAPDSGGVLEFVADGRGGIVTDLNRESLARAIDRLSNESTARELGMIGPRLTKHLSWEVVVDRLVGTIETA